MRVRIDGRCGSTLGKTWFWEISRLEWGCPSSKSQVLELSVEAKKEWGSEQAVSWMLCRHLGKREPLIPNEGEVQNQAIASNAAPGEMERNGQTSRGTGMRLWKLKGLWLQVPEKGRDLSHIPRWSGEGGNWMLVLPRWDLASGGQMLRTDVPETAGIIY